MQEMGFYTFGNRDYYETPRHVPISREYFDAVRDQLPVNWKLERFDVWLAATPPEAQLPIQGFKIHLSCAAGGGVEMLRRIVPVCVNSGVAFKVVADPALHRFMNSKRYHRGGSGKFAAIYPPTKQTFLDLLDRLERATRGTDGPYILSDKRYRGSKVVFYRYGAFQRISRLNVDGTRTMMMQAPNGDQVPDERAPYFQLPEWVVDPVERNEERSEDDDTELLNGRYRLEEALAFTNTGGVYRAVDVGTNQLVVIKEARPNTLTWAGAGSSVDAKVALRHEHACLERLRGLRCVPEVVELYEEWENTFLVVSYFDGVPLAKLRAREDFILMTKMHLPAQVIEFCCRWRELCRSVLDAVNAIHARQVIVGDISPGNVLVDLSSGAIGIIDLEGAWLAESSARVAKFGTQWHNPGFRRAESRQSAALTVEDDYYACGMLLYNVICPTQALLELDPAHPVCRILDHFVEAGLPREVRAIILSLLEGDGHAHAR